MTTDRPDPRLELAEQIAEGVRIDWATEHHPTLEADLDAFRMIATVANGYRAVTPRATPEPPRFRWGPLHVYEKVGEGAFGTVYRARDPRLDLEVALKLRRGAGPVASGSGLLAEARRLARIRHPNVVVVHGVDTHDGQLGLWTDFVRGHTLERSLSQDGPLDLVAVIQVGVHLSRALEAVHATGLVHGDVKAANVMRTDDGRIVLTDFGSAVARTSGDWEPHLRTGTPVVMAPELFRGDAPSIASDVYALGALLFRLVSGRHVVRGDSYWEIRREHQLGSVLSRRRAPDGLPGPFVRVLERALAPRPDDRFENTSEMARALSRSAEPDHNLPLIPTSFVGRVAEQASVTSHMQRSRLVTLTGAGGSGKSRLAVETARHVLHDYPEGVWLIELAPVTEARVVEAVADALQIREEPHRPLTETIVTHLAERSLLLLLDNCEHVIETVARLTDDIRARCPGVSILATSREALRVGGEQVHTTPTLPVPTDADERDPSALGTIDAVRLFEDRARAVDGSFDMTPETALVVSRICRRLDGIPLAIELAAARLRAMTVVEIDRRMDDRFRLLVSGRRTARPHHQTLRALLDWSYDLLSPPEQALLQRLSVFDGGWTLDAAEAVGGGETVPLDDVLNLLASLVEKSLVQIHVRDDRAASDPPDRGADPGTDQVMRYGMLESVRVYAQERLSREAQARLHQRHLGHYLALASEIFERERAELSPASLSTLDRDQNNLWRALDTAFDRTDPTDAARLARALSSYWYRRGMFREACDTFAAIWERRERSTDDLWVELWIAAGTACNSLKRHEDTERYVSEVRDAVARGANRRHEMRALNNLGVLKMGTGTFEECTRLFEQSLAVARELGHGYSMGVALGNLGVMARFRGDMDGSERYLTEAAECFRRSGSEVWAALTIQHRAENAFSKGDPARARELSEAALAAFRATGASREMTISLDFLAEVHMFTDHLELAEAYASESLAIRQRTGLSTDYSDWALGYMAYLRGDLDLAERFLVRALEHVSRPGDVEYGLRLLGLLACEQSRYREAAWMLGSAEALRNPDKKTPNPALDLKLDRVERALSRLRRELGDDELESARQEGAALSYADAAARARQAFPGSS